MRRALFLFLLATLPSFGESVVVVTCARTEPESAYDDPLCADQELTSHLIDAFQAGDASALAFLENRFAITKSYSERHRIAMVLLRNSANDAPIWNEIYADAQLALHFAEADDAAFEQWCEQHDFDFVRHRFVLHHAFCVAATDPRSRTLLRKALASTDSDLAITAVYGLSVMRDETALPEIEKTLERFPDEARYAADALREFDSEHADVIAKKYAMPVEEEEEAEEEEEEEEEQ